MQGERRCTFMLRLINCSTKSSRPSSPSGRWRDSSSASLFTSCPSPLTRCPCLWVWGRSIPSTRRVFSAWRCSRSEAAPRRRRPPCPWRRRRSRSGTARPPRTWCSPPGTWWRLRCWCCPGERVEGEGERGTHHTHKVCHFMPPFGCTGYKFVYSRRLCAFRQFGVPNSPNPRAKTHISNLYFQVQRNRISGLRNWISEMGPWPKTGQKHFQSNSSQASSYR